MSDFASFWHGELTPFAWACLASFPRAGASLSVFSYDPTLDLPAGVTLEDARSICPDEQLIERFTVNGKRSIATFADFFRYRMIRATARCWVDADLICLMKPAFAGEPYIYCRQADAVSTLLVNNAVLRLPPAEPALAELVATAEAAAGQDQKWGALGPFLLTPILEKHGLYGYALEPHVCYPIEPEQFWRPFLPDQRDRVAAAVHGATMLHLWSEAIVWSGLDFRVCPPEGSWLYERFASLGALSRFRRVAEEGEVLRLMAREIGECEARERRAAEPG